MARKSLFAVCAEGCRTQGMRASGRTMATARAPRSRAAPTFPLARIGHRSRDRSHTRRPATHSGGGASLSPNTACSRTPPCPLPRAAHFFWGEENGARVDFIPARGAHPRIPPSCAHPHCSALKLAPRGGGRSKWVGWARAVRSPTSACVFTGQPSLKQGCVHAPPCGPVTGADVSQPV